MTKSRSGIRVWSLALALSAADGCGAPALDSAGSTIDPLASALPPKLAAGAAVYAENCGMCHKHGHEGAPRIDSAMAWRRRIAQGQDILVEHALEGFAGQRGAMPPRGDNPELTDAQVESAVLFMVHRVQLLDE
jgi:cytochrome c5